MHPIPLEKTLHITNETIAELRGRTPDRCDFCGWVGPLDFMMPEEGGDWACWHCLWRWDTNEIAEALECVYGKPR